MFTSLQTDPDAVLEELDPEQRAVATALSGPVCVLAGAGTGKTRAITHRIAYGVHAGVYVAQQVMAVTFTARAAGELRTRLRALGVGGVQARTFHAAALRQLSYFWPQVVGGPPPSVLEHKAALIAEAGARLRLTVDRAAIRDLSAEVEWAKVSLLTPQDYRETASRIGRGEPAGFDALTVARLLEVYEDVKTDRNVIDFEDVLLLTVGILEEYPQVADAVRRQYRHFVVDEYQDVSALQQRLLELWTGERNTVCVVGDPSQTIYSFTGASADHLLAFPTRHPGATVVRLVRDYRSTPQVVRLANGLLRRAGTGAGVPASARLELIAQRPSGPEPTLSAYDDDVWEAVAVTAKIRSLIDSGTRASEIAVLFRTNAQSRQLEQALADGGVPYLMRGGERFFARKEVRDAVLLLRGARASCSAADSAADSAAGSASGSQGEGSGGSTLGDETRAVLTSAGWSVSPPSGPGAKRDQWESLQALVALADELAGVNPQATLTHLVDELQERASAQHAPTVEGVTLASLHAAKGLEWDAVMIIGLCEGLMPISLAEGWAAVEEERRLLYVGITRAREHLHLSWSRCRTPGGRANRTPSRFLEGLLGHTGDPHGAGRGSGRGAGHGSSWVAEAPDGRVERVRPVLPSSCRTCGSTLTAAVDRKIGRCSACPATYDEALLDRLRQWRADVAADAKIPPYAVFTDATLVAMAEALPVDRQGLARIPGVGVIKLDRYGDAVLAILTRS